MINFTWKITKNGYIEWDCKWDGTNFLCEGIEINEGLDQKFHPFFRTIDFKDYEKDGKDPFLEFRETGDFCANNPTTRALCEMLSKPEEIGLHSGNTTGSWYWMVMLGCLSQMWD